MSFDKRDIPLVVLEVLERYSGKSSELFRLANANGTLLRFEDNHSNPKFFFDFESFNKKQNKQFLNLNIKPKSKNDPTEFKVSSEVTQIDGYFKNWTTYLEGYKNIKMFEDPLLKQYEEEIYSEFEIVDEDADEVSYNLETQLWLEEYIENALLKLEPYKDEDETVNQIRKDLEDLKRIQTRLTKRKVTRVLAKIYAKARKHGLGLLKEIYIEVKKELIKQLISGKIELM